MEEENNFQEKKGIIAKLKKLGIWQISTMVLGVLFIASLFTGGFRLKDITGSAAVDELNAIILNDKRCDECVAAIAMLTPQLQSLFPGIKIKELDYSGKEGKELFVSNDLKVLPAVLFTEDVKTQQSYSNIASYLETKGEFFSLRVGANFNPEAEICDNGKDDDGDNVADCDDVDCANSLLCRPEIKNKLDVFVMSQCPYGVRALDSMKEVLSNFKNKINFNIHFIASETSNGVFNSLHGQGEVDENIRGLCAIKYYPTDYKYMDYIWCRNKDITSTSWENCAVSAFGTADKIKTCSQGSEGKSLLSEDIKLAEQLKISGSPTWLTNNRATFSGIDAETVKTNFCEENPNVEGCGNVLSSQSDVTGSC